MEGDRREEIAGIFAQSHIPALRSVLCCTDCDWESEEVHPVGTRLACIHRNFFKPPLPDKDVLWGAYESQEEIFHGIWRFDIN